MGNRTASRRSLITDIVTVQLVITGAITLIALAGLTWTSGAVIRNNLAFWAEQWAGELNELGAPFYLRDGDMAVLDVERFVEKYPEIHSVTWYHPDGSVFTSIDKNGPVTDAGGPLPADIIAELSAKGGPKPGVSAPGRSCNATADSGCPGRFGSRPSQMTACLNPTRTASGRK